MEVKIVKVISGDAVLDECCTYDNDSEMIVF